jgi:amino acid transporter
MSEKHKLSLIGAIFININIMLGTGFFINTVVLTNAAGSLGASVYLLVALLLLPLIISIAKLLEYHHESGTFYDFGKHVSPYFGFLSSWSYFTAKLCSATLAIHVCLSFLQKIIPALQALPLLLFDICTILLFMCLNLLNLQIGKQIQISFIFLKLIPILFVFLSGLYLFTGAHFTADTLIWSGIPPSIPFVMYAFTGFEASCSLSSHIVNSKINGPRAIFISYAIAVTTVFLYQLFFYGSLGMDLGTLTGGYLDMFPELIKQLPATMANFKHSAQPFLYLGIAASSMGSAYGILYSNPWNLYTLAKHNHTFISPLLSSLNKHGMPFACVIAEGLICIAYILITQGSQVPLQQVASLGATIAYTFSVIALFAIMARQRKSLKLPMLALLSCFVLLSSFVWTVAINGPSPMLLLFLGLLLFGTFMFYSKARSTI